MTINYTMKAINQNSSQVPVLQPQYSCKSCTKKTNKLHNQVEQVSNEKERERERERERENVPINDISVMDKDKLPGKLVMKN